MALEVSVIQALAESLVRKLLRRDPLRQRVHHRKIEALAIAAATAVRFYGASRQPARADAAVAEERQ
jgi:hypothetical protein